MTQQRAGDEGSSVGVFAAVDGSTAALGAARWAALHARCHARPLTIGCAVQLPVPSGEAGSARTDFLDALRKRCERALDRAQEVARGVLGPDHRVTTRLREGPPTPAILDLAGDADLVVLGDRGLGESPERAAGSVTSALIAYGARPVAVVRGWTGAEESLGAGPIVVGVDGSPHCTAALEFGLAEAQARGADLEVVHAWSDVPLTGLDEPHLQWESIQEREDAVLAESLAGWQERFPGVTIRREVVHDRPVRHLLGHADDAQLLVVGHRGRGGFTGMMVGSTSRALLHSAPCPLVVVRDPGER
ncbi:universal stress protein [Tomitella fengzijianii]|uniref:Universal stress protein n=1 Tax=Tomitella fengzijianii TaxID=2597660 RepID=A0A516X4V6_9ACTN|nr:universal stress protein [Tomitella fengzijianii]QDQ98080.1 universal stress protein [Tomitella fengzijianii]